MTNSNAAPRILILGIGNLLWADEGFGVRCVELLNEQYQLPENVSIVDGGTQGLYLVQRVQDADVLVVFDAVDYGLEPGTLKIVRDDDVPKFMGAKQMSLHQTGFQDVLALAEFTGSYPKSLMLVGVQPKLLEDFGGSLTEPVRAQVEPAVQIALDFIAQFGATAQQREQPVEQGALGPVQLSMAHYEQQRPSEDEVWRKGDVRYLHLLAGDEE